MSGSADDSEKTQWLQLEIVPQSVLHNDLGATGRGPSACLAVQDFHKLRQECLSAGKLFEDPEFPASYESLYRNTSQRVRSIEWKRPKELAENPQLFVDGFSRFDVQQGNVGNCWFVAATAALAMRDKLLVQMIPEDQSFDENYAGIFHFRFWQYGKWIEVVIDDRLPTIYGGQLVYLKSFEKNEFWGSLLEKAYAKLYGSYEAMSGGLCGEAWEDFTGGISELIELKTPPENLFTILLKAHERGSLIGCLIDPNIYKKEDITPEGLVKGHAYSITDVNCVATTKCGEGEELPMIRIRNPWGTKVEWKGPWSDTSQEWDSVPDCEKQKLGLKFEEDGEFWMSVDHIIMKFNAVEICNLQPDSLSVDDLKAGKKKWETNLFDGKWVRGATAGGNPNNHDTFWRNPQYRITVGEPDEGEDMCTVIIALMQKHLRVKKCQNEKPLIIGFIVYRLEQPDELPKPLNNNFFGYNRPIFISQFTPMRQIVCRQKFPPGVYCIVPCVYNPDEEGEFLLRVFSEKRCDMEENDESIGSGVMDERVKDKTTPDEDKELLDLFKSIAGDDMEIDALELKQILDAVMSEEIHGKEFSKDICQRMITMMDVDRSGKLGLEEFMTLWMRITVWMAVFKLYEKDNSGFLNAFELRDALNSAGYRLNNNILTILAGKYAMKNGKMAFDDFLLCAIKLHTVMRVLEDMDANKTDTPMFTMNDWINEILYF